jgi:hypothetical protein
MLTQKDVEEIQEGLKSVFPYVKTQLSTLGGIERASILVTLSFDSKETWANDILHNSRYAMFSIHSDMKIEKFSGYQTPKFRKANYKSNSDFITKLKEWKEKPIDK